MFGIDVHGVWCESCLCGNALELASEALNGALWMGSYLQGFALCVIRKHMTALPALIEQKASRLKGESAGGDWRGNI